MLKIQSSPVKSGVYKAESHNLAKFPIFVIGTYYIVLARTFLIRAFREAASSQLERSAEDIPEVSLPSNVDLHLVFVSFAESRVLFRISVDPTSRV